MNNLGKLLVFGAIVAGVTYYRKKTLDGYVSHSKENDVEKALDALSQDKDSDDSIASFAKAAEKSQYIQNPH